MTPATHAAVAAVAASKIRSLPAALAAAFVLHFAADFLYHFEAFYPLSVLGQWPETYVQIGLYGLLALLAVPLVWRVARRDPGAGTFALFAAVLSLIPFDPSRSRRVLWALLAVSLWLVLSRPPESRRWGLCALAGYLPDLIRHWVGPLNRLHQFFHYNAELDLGDWISRAAAGRWKIPVNDRIFDPWYRAGYAAEIALEGLILFGCLYWLSRRPRAAELPAVHDQDRSVDVGGLVR